MSNSKQLTNYSILLHFYRLFYQSDGITPSRYPDARMLIAHHDRLHNGCHRYSSLFLIVCKYGPYNINFTMLAFYRKLYMYQTYLSQTKSTHLTTILLTT